MKPVPSTVRPRLDTMIGQWVPHPSGPDPQAEKQPFIKLHGSSNWSDDRGNQLLVMGGNEPSLISRYPILKWNHEQFKTYLSYADTRLMVIGYSFGDAHINHAIIESSTNNKSIQIFIIDLLGLDVIDENRRHPMYTPGALVSALKDRVIGASRRSLREIFGNDRVEHAKVMRFFG